MIIKSLYIDKFGGISDKRMEFESTINVICAQNEAGKSTVAEFIKIMLYGLGKSPQNIRSNERTRFMPWGEKRMGGELTVLSQGRVYTIIRSFGKRKSDDTVSVINSLTGAKETELCVECPGEILLGIGRDGFEKSLYIKQLSTKIESGKTDDEILKKLLNLAQSGDEGVSYQRAVQILDSAAKELSGTRPKGKIPLVQDEINSLLSQRSVMLNREQSRKDLAAKLNSLTLEKSSLEGYKTDKTMLENLKKEYTEALAFEASSKQINEVKKRKTQLRIKGLLVQIIISVILALAVLFFKPLCSIPLIIWAVIAFVLLIRTKKIKIDYTESKFSDKILKEIQRLEKESELKEKNNTTRLVEVAQMIGDIKNQLSNIEITPLSETDDKIRTLQEKLNLYNQNISDIALAKRCLQEAFEELQQSFGKKLNVETSLILKEITGCKYSEVLVDNEYNMLVRTDKNELRDAQYLSNGTYDQIYFALRMAIINILFDEVPIILDEAFVQYDDERLKLAIEYIKKIKNRQIFLFSCHSRESELISSKAL